MLLIHRLFKGSAMTQDAIIPLRNVVSKQNVVCTSLKEHYFTTPVVGDPLDSKHNSRWNP